MGLQEIMNAMADANKRTRSHYHVRLGDLISALENSDDLTIKFDNGGYPAKPHSYRGYDSDLAIEPNYQPVKSKTFLGELKEVLDKTLEGYEGGDNVMDKDVPLWCAHYSMCGSAIIKIIIENDAIILETKDVD